MWSCGRLTWLHHAPPIRAWTEKMMRHATTEETLEISLELMTSPKLCQFTASLLTLLTLLLLLCSLVFCIDLQRSSASESSIIKWESLCWSGLSTVIQLSAALNGTLCDWLDMIWQQKNKGRSKTPKTRPWPCSPQPEPYQCSSCKESVRERERGCQKSEAFCVPPKQDSYFIFAVHDWFLFSIGEMKAGHSCIFFGMVKENLLRAIPNTHSLCAKPEFSFVIWSPFQAAACVWLWFFWLIMFMLKALTQKK